MSSPLVKQLECHHTFHYHCIHHWLSVNPSCPRCKRSTVKTIKTTKKAKPYDRKAKKARVVTLCDIAPPIPVTMSSSGGGRERVPVGEGLRKRPIRYH